MAPCSCSGLHLALHLLKSLIFPDLSAFYVIFLMQQLVFPYTLSILPLDPILLSGTSPTFITGSRKHLFICASNSQFLIVFVILVTKLNGT